MTIYRGMTEKDGKPSVGSSARELGIRPKIDVQAIHPSDVVGPGGGGMSVSPGDPTYLPKHRRPPEFGGTGRDPIWGIEIDSLGADLTYRPDPSNASHGFIEPARIMTLEAFLEALAGSQPRWFQVSSTGVDP